MARDIARKLRLTTALLSTATCKDLAAVFQRANPATSFNVDRAYKWQQGRAQPRERQLYEDWAKVLELSRSGVWIAECDVDTFLAEIAARHGRDPDALRRRADTAIVVSGEHVPEHAISGSFACYSPAWSPYFSGRLIRGHLTIAMAPATRRLVATYSEALPTGRIELEGPVTIGERLLHFDVRDRRGDAHLVFCLFPPSPPVSILGGLLCGGTFLGPEVKPAVSRIVIVRLPAVGSPPSLAGDAYLPTHASVSADLAALGLAVADPAALDRGLALFLTGKCDASEQISPLAYKALVNLFDRAWFMNHENAGA